MRIHLIAIGNRMPAWVQEGFAEYAGRLPPECRLNLVEIAPGKRTRAVDLERVREQEGERMLSAIPKSCHVIALDMSGRAWDTPELSRQMQSWLQSGQDIALLVGGPEGLADACRQQAREAWSLSALTLPHPLVRVLVAEQLYRAWSILQNHPYHR